MKKKILFVVNDIDFFISHRLEIANKMISLNFDVSVVGNEKKKNYFDQKISKKINFYSIKLNRSSFGLVNNFLTLLKLFFILKKIKPDIVHYITLKPIFFGLFINIFYRAKKIIFSISGLGLIFSYNRTLKKNLISYFISFILKILIFLNHRVTFIVQNERDKNYIRKLNKKTYIYLIKGSGVDIDKFYPSNSVNNKIRILMASRIIKEKGVFEYLFSANQFKGKKDIEFILCGKIDQNNSSYISKKDITNLSKINNVSYIGEIQNMFEEIYKSSICILPSYYGEGVPKFLLEAASSGKAIITTKIPGCEDTIIEGYNGILIPPQNVKALTNAIKDLIDNKDLLKKMSLNSRKFAIKNFDVKEVVEKHINIYI